MSLSEYFPKVKTKQTEKVKCWNCGKLKLPYGNKGEPFAHTCTSCALRQIKVNKSE